MKIKALKIKKSNDDYMIEITVDKEPKHFIEEWNRQVPFGKIEKNKLIEAIKKDIER